MSYELIITEKPNAAKKIAEALADGKAIKKSAPGNVPYYEVTHGKRDIVIVSAVGHIFGLTPVEGAKKSIYPFFDIRWAPSADFNKGAAFTKKYLTNIKKLAKGADEFTVATDYDIEGEVIGLNVIRYCCKQKDANRMKFSTLTKGDLIKAYEGKSKTLDWGQANAGETRHKMDWYFGINLSRALTAAVKTTGSFKLMSTGRVQGPALKLVVDKEKSIQAFVPEPYWQIELKGSIKEGKVIAMHEGDKIFDKAKAETIYNTCKRENQATVASVTNKKFKSAPPNPFDLTSLQIEAHKCLKISPKDTLALAQELYTAGYTSYPRTSSQQLPKEIGYEKILKLIQRNPFYVKEAKFLLAKKELKPNNGKKKDAAHPAIYPTGIIPDFKSEREGKLYDLIVRRFLATFGDDAIRQTMTVKLDCNKEIFTTKGTTTVEKGWFELYGKHVMLKEEELPPINKDEICIIESLKKLDKETTPPKRYTESSIIKALEKENLGTKATRASIIETLFNRKYIEGKSLAATEIGIRTEEILEKYSPKIVDPALTRNFEEQMEEIREKTKTQEAVLEDVKVQITDILTEFDKHIKKIGAELLGAERETQFQQSLVGKCPTCETGSLVIKKGKFGQFIACDKYPDCKTIFKIPQVKINTTEEVCEVCNHPMIEIPRLKAAPLKLCINPNCPTKTQNQEDPEAAKKIHEKEGTVCPKCKKGKLVMRKSIYGQFLACDKYPDCKYVEQTTEKKEFSSNKKFTKKEE